MTNALPHLEMEERSAPPLRPRRRGMERRAPRGGTKGLRGASRALLDTDKYPLATSVREWLQATESPRFKRQKQLAMQRVLMASLEKLWRPTAENGRQPANAQRQRDWERLGNCQMEWIGFRADCCTRETVAVPIGCNHRLCVLCNSHRAATYRQRVAELFDHMAHPVFLTLTVPNCKRLNKQTYRTFRDALKQLLKQHGGWIRGGLYSIETTYNREAQSWHVHAHVLIDAAAALPRSRGAFIRFKRQIEFDWLHLTATRGERVHRTFAGWMGAISERDSATERPARRVVDVRPVRQRQRAAAEVLKYITKISAFSDCPEAVEEFLTAVKHTRMIQTFGSWYGYKFAEDVNDPTSWKKLRCDCGANLWQKIGIFFKHECCMDRDGRWRVLDTAMTHKRKPPDRSGPEWKQEIEQIAARRKTWATS